MVGVIKGPELLRYSFPDSHPMRSIRIRRFFQRLESEQKLMDNIRIIPPRLASEDEITLFHDKDYVTFVKMMSEKGSGYLDYGDTPAYPGVYEAACYVVGSTLEACKLVIDGHLKRCFNPMGGLHHATRRSAAGFCVFNDVGVAIEYLLKVRGLDSVAYVDIDAHHGDGVCYSFYDSRKVIFVDIHQDGRTLYPGTGFRDEIGEGEGKGFKLNIPLPPGSTDEDFKIAMLEARDFLLSNSFDIILFQAGADGIRGDPITNLSYSPMAHAFASKILCEVANRRCSGRIVGMGGGGYNPENVAEAWINVVKTFVEEP